MGRKEAEVWPEEMTRQGERGRARGGRWVGEGWGGREGSCHEEPMLRKEKHRQSSASASRSFLGRGS